MPSYSLGRELTPFPAHLQVELGAKKKGKKRKSTEMEDSDPKEQQQVLTKKAYKTMMKKRKKTNARTERKMDSLADELNLQL